MNLSKSYEVFDPFVIKDRIHIIGCGSVGSTIAELLARYGLNNFVLYDFDVVEAKNIHNQMFFSEHIGRNKAECVAEMMTAINPEIEGIKVETKGWNGQRLDGYVFLAVDSIELRKKIVSGLMYNPFVKGVFDVRTRLFDAQHYAADWKDSKQKKNLLDSMDFSHDEAAAETPMSACGEVLGVAATVRLISTYAVCNFINFVSGKGIKKLIVADINMENDSPTLAI